MDVDNLKTGLEQIDENTTPSDSRRRCYYCWQDVKSAEIQRRSSGRLGS